MNEESSISQEAIDKVYHKLKWEAERSGYRLNGDVEFTKKLVRGLLVNEKRYGYWSCPCRLASGNKAEDLDIICPCDYRDPDLNDHGACFCALYVTQAVLAGKEQMTTVPERRAPEEVRARMRSVTVTGGGLTVPLTVWRCTVCGYLCSRDEPPEVCPICFAKKDRFAKFIEASKAKVPG